MAIESRKVTLNPTAPALTRTYAWFSALVSDDLVMLDDLLMHGVPIDVVHPLRHSTALMEATRLGRTALVDWLLARGAAPAFFSGAPMGTCLHSALRRKYWDIAHLLLDAMETPAVIDAYGCTPLHVVCMEAQSKKDCEQALALARLLIEKNCPLDALDHEGITALHHCVINDAPELAELLLTNGANVDAMIPDSWVSPLTIAALEKNMCMASLLLGFKADMNLKTREGSSPASIYPAIAKLARG